MTENKTQVTGASADEFVAGVEHPVRRQDGLRLLDLMAELTGEGAEMWGPTIVGFGRVHYKYATGREGDMPAVGFSPRKASLSLYGLTNAPESVGLLARLGKHKTGAGCLYVNKLADVDEAVLAELITLGYRHLSRRRPCPGSLTRKPPPSASRRNPTAGAVSSSGYLPATTSSSITAATSS
jgi:hypothetical protein